MPPSVFGVREFTEASSPSEGYAEEIRIAGFCILRDVIGPETLVSSRDSLDRIYEIQLEEIGGPERLAMINDRWTVRAPLAYDALFLKMAAIPEILSVVTALIGSPFCLMLQNGVINVPLNGQQPNTGAWHRDLNYQHFVSSRPLSISVLFCIDEFTEENGATMVLPGSHKVERFPSDSYVDGHQHTIRAPAGSAILFDSMLFHRGGFNRSGQPRRAVNHMYSIPLLKQQISFPRLLQGRHADDPLLRQLLGYDFEPAESVTAFREVRLARARKQSESE
ncbi:MAG: phytanoyl-CoA dioxygenase family protein [Acidobacteriota bacterium]